MQKDAVLGQAVDPSLSRFSSGSPIPGTPYEALALLGVGGMGSVYEVRHRVLGRRFVLKALHGQLTSRRDLVARMANEWRTLGALNHKNIVSVTDAGFTSDGVPYYVMERLEGETLADLLRRRGRLEPREAAKFTLDILDGLAAAHSIGAIHRDIKPQNVFVSGEMAKVLDFGVAKLRDKSAMVVTAVGLTIGTPRYMSPEQAAGGEIDTRSDIYASGLVFFEMLTGKSPFQHIKDPQHLVLAQMSEEPPRVDWVQPELPAELGDLLQRWLAKEPRARPPSAQAALHELKALVGSLPAVIEPTNVTEGGHYEAETVGPDRQRARAPGGTLVGQGEVPAPLANALAQRQAEEALAVAPTESVLRAAEGSRRLAEERAKGEGALLRLGEETHRPVTRGPPGPGANPSAAGSLRLPLIFAGFGLAFLALAGLWVQVSGGLDSDLAGQDLATPELPSSSSISPNSSEAPVSPTSAAGPGAPSRVSPAAPPNSPDEPALERGAGALESLGSAASVNPLVGAKSPSNQPASLSPKTPLTSSSGSATAGPPVANASRPSAQPGAQTTAQPSSQTSAQPRSASGGTVREADPFAPTAPEKLAAPAKVKASTPEKARSPAVSKPSSGGTSGARTGLPESGL